MPWLLVLFFVVWVAALWLYLNAVAKTLSAVPEQYRAMQPSAVWLALIPFFSIYWAFRIVHRLKLSFDNLSDAGLLTQPSNAGYVAGLISAIISAALMVERIVRSILKRSTQMDQEVVALLAILGLAALVPYLISWIVHWRQVVVGRRYIKN